MDNRPIGVFDSGLGGLTVLKEIMELVPGESIVYFGDCGRIPYGTKSKETITKYALQDVRFLLTHDVKMIVIACNTASAMSYDKIKSKLDIPVIEVIYPGAMAAVRETRNKKVGIIGTKATIRSRAYEKVINKLDASIETFSADCPLFVQLVEEGWWDNDITYRIAEKYLTPLKEKGIDTLVLGCTHYPLLAKTISEVVGSGVKLVSSATETARVVQDVINSKCCARDPEIKPVYSYYTSDSIDSFVAFGSAFLGNKVCSVGKTDIEKY